MLSCLTFWTNVPQSFLLHFPWLKVILYSCSFIPIDSELTYTHIALVTRWNILSRTIFAFLMLQFAIFPFLLLRFFCLCIFFFWSFALIKDSSILKMISIFKRMCIKNWNKIHVKRTSKNRFRPFLLGWLHEQ